MRKDTSTHEFLQLKCLITKIVLYRASELSQTSFHGFMYIKLPCLISYTALRLVFGLKCTWKRTLINEKTFLSKCSLNVELGNQPSLLRTQNSMPINRGPWFGHFFLWFSYLQIKMLAAWCPFHCWVIEGGNL